MPSWEKDAKLLSIGQVEYLGSTPYYASDADTSCGDRLGRPKIHYPDFAK